MTTPDDRPEFVLTLSCPDRVGVVHSVVGFLADRQCTIEQSGQYGDPETRTFFMRVQFAPTEQQVGLEGLVRDFGFVAERFGMSWRLEEAHARPRVLLMVSKFGHCLNDLLFRVSIGALRMDVVAVVSNHTDFARLTENYGVPFHHVPVTAETKQQSEAELMGLVRELDVELVVLARYMQVLSEEVCRALPGRVINIHHSMLPSFKGARPYQQAHARGVKVIGASAHYVTADLDEGPIIEQEVARITHAMTPDEVSAIGRDLECQALARAVRWHCENRVMLNGGRTVVLL